MSKFYYDNLLANQNITARSNLVWVADFPKIELNNDKETGQIHFVNDRTKIWRTTVKKRPEDLRDLVKNDFHLFPNAGD